MRTSQLVVGFVSSALIGACFIAGCSSTTTDTPTADAGVDSGPVIDASVPDADASANPAIILDSAVDAVACVNDADLDTDPVASIPIGDGGATSITCVTCARGSCSAALDACNNECPCRQLASAFFACLGGGGQLIDCAGPIISAASSGGPASASALGACMATSCAPYCGIGNFPTDAGLDAAPDAK